MKKYLFSIVTFILVSIASFAQLKVHSDNHVSIGSLTNIGGVQIYSNGYTEFQPSLYDNWAWLNIIYAPLPTSKCWIVRDNSGVHTFHVRGNGDVLCNVLYQLSDQSIKTNVSEITGATEKIMNLRGVYFDFISETRQDSLVFSDNYGNAHTHITNSDNTDNLLNNEYINPSAANNLISERSRHHMGLIAQEVEEIVPEVVRTQTDGRKAVAYSSLIPLLIEALKEQQQQIAELQEQIANIGQGEIEEKSINDQNTINSEYASSAKAILYQNIPNPFSTETEIKYYVSDNTTLALLLIFDMQGMLKKQVQISAWGNGSVTINASELPAGMYIYSLIVDGVEIDSKRMILTE